MTAAVLLRLAAMALVLAASTAGAARAAEFRALLVGVSAYERPHLFTPLLGPANDVRLIRDALRARGFQGQAIVTLVNTTGPDGRPADLPSAQGRPTRARILRELDALADRSDPGDVAFILLAGHGSRQLNDNQHEDPEPDGLDEIFLPEDVGRANEVGAVQNALVDDEIGARLEAIRAKGAFVVFVSDSCYSESSTRMQASSAPRRTREVKPDALGITDEQLSAARVHASGVPGTRGARIPLERSRPGQGGLVAIFGAQSTETAPEMPLPRNTPPEDSANWYGLLSYTLAGLLASHPGITYRQAFLQLLESYRAEETSVPTPVMDGLDEDLDRLIFGAESRFLRQWRVEAGRQGRPVIAAGRLHGLTRGSILAITRTAAAIEESAILGYVEVIAADMLQSDIAPIAHAGRSALPFVEAGTFARLVDARFIARITVALPQAPSQLAGMEMEARRQIDHVRSAGVPGLDVEWVPEGSAGADLRLLLRERRLWFAPPSGEIVLGGPGRTPNLSIPPGGGTDPQAWDQFRREVEIRLARAARLRTLFSLTRELASTELAREVAISIEVQRAGRGDRERFRLGALPDAWENDLLTFTVTNNGRNPVDLTVLFVTSDHEVKRWFPNGGSNRIHRGDTLTSRPDDDLRINLDTLGVEHWVFLLARPGPQGAPVDFSFMAQDGLSQRTASGSRGPVRAATLLDLLRAADRAGATRGGERAPVTQAAAATFSWTVLPNGHPGSGGTGGRGR